jgi:tetratricopeptide (TPR) repeat protein
MRAALVLWGALSVGLSCSVALAAPPSTGPSPSTLPPEVGGTSAEADALFLEGRALLQQGKVAEACAKLTRSNRIAPAVGTLINLGFCHEQLGRMLSAMEAYSEAEILARRAGDTKRATFAVERIADVSPRMMKLKIRVSEPETPGLVVQRNKVDVPRTDFGVPVPIDPDEILLTATAPGRAPWSLDLHARGEGATLDVLVPPLREKDGGPSREQSGVQITTKRAGAIALGAVGVTAIASALVLGLTAKSRYDDSLAFCDASGCDARAVDAQRSAVSQGNIATLIGALGLAATGAGVYFWITGGPSTGAAPAGAQVSVGARFF